MKHEVIILGSECARVDHYADRCLIGYCAGCNFQQSFGDERYMPALIIDGTVVLHSCLPSDDVLDEVLKEYLV